MRKILFLLLFLVWAITLPAPITRKQADVIVLEFLENKEIQPGFLYIHANTPREETLVITTSNEEVIKVKCACWVYCLNESDYSKCRYLFVKEIDGILLEIIANNDSGPDDFDSWEIVATIAGIPEKEVTIKQPYPNPVNDLLTIPCNGESVRVEIYDLDGTRLFSGLVSGSGACQLDVSFLKAGIYIVSMDGQTSKIVKR